MPKNKEIIASIEETAATMGVEVPKLIHEDGKVFSNIELGEALTALRASGDNPDAPKEDAPKEDAPKEDAPKADAAAKEVKKAKKVYPYSIAPGKSLTSKKGILQGGDEIKASYLAGGDASLATHVKNGIVIKA